SRSSPGRNTPRRCWRWRPASTSPSCDSTTRRSSIPIRRCGASRRSRRSRIRCWSMAIHRGGNTLSITKGIISRIEFVPYNFPVSGLRVQIDAAINPGNSGGPAVVGDRMVGLAFSHLGGADNIGYIIPGEEIELFLKDIADGHYDGKPAI